MSFWTYMLHCRGESFYAGHTDNLESRIGLHQSGMLKGFTSDKLPIKLVWAAECGSRAEALAMALRIKGWSPAKKMALIRDDWDEVSRLARSMGGLNSVRAELVEASSSQLPTTPKKDDPSTSSGRTELVK